jgi:hypothetical protein
MTARTVEELREDAATFRRFAAHVRKLIEQEERPFGRGQSPRWPETRALLLDLAAQWEAMAARVSHNE